MFNYEFGGEIGPDGLTPEERIRQLQYKQAVDTSSFKTSRAEDFEGPAPPEIQDGPTPKSQAMIAAGSAILAGDNMDFLGQLGAGGQAFQAEFQRQREEQRRIEQLRFKNEQDAQLHKESLARGEREAIRQQAFMEDRQATIKEEVEAELEQTKRDEQFDEDNLTIISKLEERAAAGDPHAIDALESIRMYVDNDAMGGEAIHNLIGPIYQASVNAASEEAKRQQAGDQYGKIVGDQVVMTRPDGTQYLAPAPGLEDRRRRDSKRTAAELVAIGATSANGTAILDALKFTPRERRARAEDHQIESVTQPLSEDKFKEMYGEGEDFDEYQKNEPAIMARRGYYRNEDGGYEMKIAEAEKTINFEIFKSNGIPIARKGDIPLASLAQIKANANDLIKVDGLSVEETTRWLAEQLLYDGLTEDLAMRLAKEYAEGVNAPGAAGEEKDESLADEIKREGEEGKGILQKTSEWWKDGREDGDATGNEIFPAIIESIKGDIGDAAEAIGDLGERLNFPYKKSRDPNLTADGERPRTEWPKRTRPTTLNKAVDFIGSGFGADREKESTGFVRNLREQHGKASDAITGGVEAVGEFAEALHEPSGRTPPSLSDARDRIKQEFGTVGFPLGLDLEMLANKLPKEDALKISKISREFSAPEVEFLRNLAAGMKMTRTGSTPGHRSPALGDHDIHPFAGSMIQGSYDKASREVAEEVQRWYMSNREIITPLLEDPALDDLEGYDKVMALFVKFAKIEE